MTVKQTQAWRKGRQEAMATYLLTWNPDESPWDYLDESIADVERQGFTEDRWSTGVTKKIRRGDRVFLMRLGQPRPGQPRGIIAAGKVISAKVSRKPHWDPERAARGDLANYVNIKFDAVLDLDKVFPLEALGAPEFAGMHWTPQASGVTIPDKVAGRLDVAWQRWLRRWRRAQLGRTDETGIEPSADSHGPSLVKGLKLYEDYSRREVHNIFSPDTVFTPQAGKWEFAGIVSVPNQPGDFVVFVTFGKQQGQHVFDEQITESGVLSWQSQPKQTLADRQIQTLIAHDELANSIYLFQRTKPGKKYTYLGRLMYLTHDAERERPVWFQWQILDWDVPEEVLERIELQLQPDNLEASQEPETRDGLIEVMPPAVTPAGGVPTRAFRGRKATDQAAKDASNRELGLLGEQLVLAQEQAGLRAAGRADLADRVRHVSSVQGDGLGYDILTFEADGTEKYIEVKTTRGVIESSFYLTSNEVAFSAQHAGSYYLVRVFEYAAAGNKGKFYVRRGDVSQLFQLTPVQYRVKPV